MTEVEAQFAEDGRVRVLSFTWRGRREAVLSQGRQWEVDEGRHVLVMTAGERVFELVHRPTAGTWRVVKAPEGPQAA